MKVCRYDEGNTTVFTCPYHGWSYGTDGALVGVPYLPRGLSFAARQGSKWGLVEVAQLYNYKGIDLGHLGCGGAAVSRISRRLPPLPRPAPRRLGRPRGPGRSAGRHPEVADAVQLEIPGREFQRRHLSQYQPPLGRSGRHRAVGRRPSRHGRARREPQAACLHSRSRPPDDPLRAARPASRRRPPIRIRRSSPSISAIARRSGGACAARRPADRRARRDLPQHRAALAPAAHDGRVASAQRASDRSAGAGSSSIATRRREVKNFLRDYYIRYSGPAGMTEQDDMENWNYAHAASRGTIARRYPYNYDQGMRHRGRELRVAGPARARRGDRPHRGAVERAADAQLLPPLGRVHGGRQLGRARDVAARAARERRRRNERRSMSATSRPARRSCSPTAPRPRSSPTRGTGCGCSRAICPRRATRRWLGRKK